MNVWEAAAEEEEEEEEEEEPLKKRIKTMLNDKGADSLYN